MTSTATPMSPEARASADRPPHHFLTVHIDATAPVRHHCDQADASSSWAIDGQSGFSVYLNGTSDQVRDLAVRLTQAANTFDQIGTP